MKTVTRVIAGAHLLTALAGIGYLIFGSPDRYIVGSIALFFSSVNIATGYSLNHWLQDSRDADNYLHLALLGVYMILFGLAALCLSKLSTGIVVVIIVIIAVLGYLWSSIGKPIQAL